MSETNQTDADITGSYVDSINGRVNFATPTSGGLADVGVTPPAAPPAPTWTSPSASAAVGQRSDAPTVSGASLELDAVDASIPLTTDRLVSDRTVSTQRPAQPPIETILELKDLSIGYAKQETVEPIKNLAKWAGYGLGGAVFMALGGFLLALALLRGLQQVSALDGGWSWVPYLAVTAALGVAIALTARAMTTPKTPRGNNSD